MERRNNSEQIEPHQPCTIALRKLEKAKQSKEECVRYSICPDCGEDLVTVFIDPIVNLRKLTCSECRRKFTLYM